MRKREVNTFALFAIYSIVTLSLLYTTYSKFLESWIKFYIF